MTKNTGKFGFGIIGCGMIANFHARAVGDIRGAKVVACYDAVPASADRFAAAQGCRAYHRLDQMLADPAVDVVTVGTPSGAASRAGGRRRAGGQACDRRETARDYAQAMRSDHPRVRKEQGQVLGHLSFAIPPLQHRTQTCHGPGPLRTADPGRSLCEVVSHAGLLRQRRWRGTWELDGGGALMNQAIHSVDILTWLMGPVVEITAHVGLLAHERIAVEDTAVATLKFANGALGVIEASTAAYPGYLKRIEIHGSEGSAAMEEEDVVAWDFAKKARGDAAVQQRMAARTSTAGGASDPAAIGHHGHTEQFRDVLEAIRDDRSPAVDGREGRRSVEIILGIYKAAETGKVLKLPLASDPVLAARKKKK